MLKKYDDILFFENINKKNSFLVGGKNGSLAKMYNKLGKKVLIPNGFCITSNGYKKFLQKNKLKKKIEILLKKIKKDNTNIYEVSKEIRSLFFNSKMPKELLKKIEKAYEKLSKNKNFDVAVRSSATAEDLPKSSFAGQLESYLNINNKKDLINACIKCFASLFTERAIFYRMEKGFSNKNIYISVGIQKMVRSDKASSGVIFTIDTETGFKNIIIITSSYGLCENIVQGKIEPDEFRVFKPFLNKKNPILEKKLGSKKLKMIYSKNNTKNILTTKKEQNSFSINENDIKKLAIYSNEIEKLYNHPMDIEWAKDGINKKLYIVQARFETVESEKNKSLFQKYKLIEKTKPILKAIAIGEKIATGKVQIIKSIKEIKKFKNKNILVTYNTTPDWVPIMKKASGIITDHGGRTSHAAIVSRELGIPAIVGTGNGTKILKNNMKITLSCSEGDTGYIYNKTLKFIRINQDIKKLKKIKTPIMINISSPKEAFKWSSLPISGIGLARMEFIITNLIKIHPMAFINFSKVKDKNDIKKIEKLTKDYKSKKDFFIDTLSNNIKKIASSMYPKKVIIRLSDFKTNEYEKLIAGKYFETKEENPMIGFRGASRYYSKEYKKAFDLECISIKKAIEDGFSNIVLMIPFCRTEKEASKILSILKKNKIDRKKTKIYMMCEIPSNIFLAEKFSKKFDGFSIGSNDLTQLILGVDRDSEKLKDIFDPTNEAVKIAIKNLIKIAHKNKCRVGICGEAPSDNADFAKFLIDQKIDSISINPESFFKILKKLERNKKKN
jgi:pyruvate,water dikinase